MYIEIICNPNSGRGSGLHFARKIKTEFAMRGENDVNIFESLSIEDTEKRFAEIVDNGIKVHTFIFIGGDGTISICIDRMLKSGLNIPIAIFPCGTVNDFSKSFGMTTNIKKFVDTLMMNKTVKCDIARVNGNYTVNVACGGYFTHGANTYSRKAKRIIGKLTYYIKGMFSAFGMSPQRLRITVDGKVFEEDILMYMVINSKSVGGFSKMGAKTKINDGKFDLYAVKFAGLSLVWTFFKLLFGKHTYDKNVIYTTGKIFKIELIENIRKHPITKKIKKYKTNEKFIHSDLDGNVGPALPLEVKVLGEVLTIFSRKTETPF